MSGVACCLLAVILSMPRQTCCDCAGDMDGSGTVDGGDLAALLGAWGTSGTPGLRCEDIEPDGIVDGADLGALLGLWGGCVALAPGNCATCNAANDCCSVTDTPGCSDAACCAAVCATDPHCCEVRWDYACVDDAAFVCPGLCPGPRECGTASHDCLTVGGPGCNDEVCCAQVCAQRYRCCWLQWDSLCVELAELFCYGSGCELPCDGRPEAEPCGTQVNGGCFVPLTGVSTCCYASGGVDCDDVDCLKAVCAIDPFCCMVAWDHICAEEALTLCPKLCAIGSLGCCVPGAPLGCTDESCVDVVCAVDPVCCARSWDWICSSYALDLCPTTCAEVQLHLESLECGEIVCGTLGDVYVPPFGDDDVDHFRLIVPETHDLTLIRVTLHAQLDTEVGLYPSECGAWFSDWAHTGLCGTADIAFCVPPGTYDVIVKPYASHQLATSPICGGPSDYVLIVTCEDCGATGNCCVGHDGPGCGDRACTAAVCLADPGCCTSTWDNNCVYLATGLCTTCGGPGPDADCCVLHPYPGCGDDACELLVCADDPFCCTSSWDLPCREAATIHCAICGGGVPGSDCCGANGGAGCSDPACEAAICDDDDWCCEVSWDYACGNAAENLCPQCAGWP